MNKKYVVIRLVREIPITLKDLKIADNVDVDLAVEVKIENNCGLVGFLPVFATNEQAEQDANGEFKIKIIEEKLTDGPTR